MKKGRQEKILEIITEKDVETQEELADILRREGFHVTQATVSRDIRDLGLSKAAGKWGRQRYVVSGKALGDAKPGAVEERYIRVLKEGFSEASAAQNLVVIRTVSGMAMAVAAALDALKFPEVLGCIAGDDTIMVACRTDIDAAALAAKMKKMV